MTQVDDMMLSLVDMLKEAKSQLKDGQQEEEKIDMTKIS